MPLDTAWRMGADDPAAQAGGGEAVTDTVLRRASACHTCRPHRQGPRAG